MITNIKWSFLYCISNSNYIASMTTMVKICETLKLKRKHYFMSWIVYSSALLPLLIVSELFYNSKNWRKQNNFNSFCSQKCKPIASGGTQVIIIQWVKLILFTWKSIPEIISLPACLSVSLQSLFLPLNSPLSQLYYLIDFFFLH